MTDRVWHKKVDRLAKGWLRRGCATPSDVATLHERGQCSWSRQRLFAIADDVEREPIPFHWRPLWWRRRRESWGERISRGRE